MYLVTILHRYFDVFSVLVSIRHSNVFFHVLHGVTDLEVHVYPNFLYFVFLTLKVTNTTKGRSL